MARPAIIRVPAVPRSQDQRDRIDRVMKIATELVTQTGFDGLQMTDIARQSGVSTATLYRYFPSKTHLLVAIQARQVETFAQQVLDEADGVGPAEEAVAKVLITAVRNLLHRPVLGSALVLSSNIANPAIVPDVVRLDSTFRRLIMGLLGITEPTERDATAVRLLLQVWHGISMAVLNGRMSVSHAESDIRLAARVLLDLRSTQT